MSIIQIVSKNLKFAVVVPCFNESLRFDQKYFIKIQKAINKSLGYLVFIFVDDGSDDSTYEEILKLTSRPHFHCIKLSKNVGKANAIRIGIAKAIKMKAEFVAYLDSDKAFQEKEVTSLIASFIDEFENGFIDMLIFSRVKLAGHKIERKWYRHVIGRIIATILNLRSNIHLYDSQSGFKIIGNKLLKPYIYQTPFSTRWFIDWEIILRANKQLRIREVPIKVWQEKHGSKLRLSMILQILIEIFKIKRMQKRSKSGLIRK